jgi:dolichyl-phosphate-mannose--protein O-mannosyl transferase
MKFRGMGSQGKSPDAVSLPSSLTLLRFAGDANDDFIVELTPQTRGGKDKRKARERVRTLRSHFRLKHALTGCYLFSHKVKLPEWGFEQQEVRSLAKFWYLGLTIRVTGDLQQEPDVGQFIVVCRDQYASAT